ncbi:MAG: peptidylprolyl isomerase [Pseudomonadota bacterium]|nr:peptidylprolyl isomerase [Pseudomonadota bacterium]
MKNARLLSFLIACCALPVQAAAAPDAADKPLAVVNGEAVPGLYASFIRQNRVKRNMPPESLTDDAIKEGAVTATLLAQEAVKKGLDKNPTVAAALEFQKMELLGRAALEDYLRAHPITDETVKAEYENAKEKAGETEYRARHILVNSEKEAKEMLAKLNARKKAKFEDLAKKYSKDTSAGNGGDLGWVLPANLVPEFAQTMVDLKKGEITKNPVQTRFGWHVIRLEETRKLDFPDYEKIKNRIAGQLQQQQIGKLVRELAATAKIE